MDIIDPSEDMPDLMTGVSKASRLRKLAKLLRKEVTHAPQGQMVGGRFVAPNLASQLVPLAGDIRTSLADARANTAEDQSVAAQSNQAAQWLRNMPQAQPGGQIPGPVDEGMPELGMRPEVPVSREAVLKHTLAGMHNPQTAAMAKVYGTDALKGIDAQDTRDFKASESAETRAARLEGLRAQLENQMAIKQAQIASAEKLGQGANAMKLELGQLKAASDRFAAEMRLEAAHARASSVGNKPDRQTENKIEDSTLALSKRMDNIAPIAAAARNVQNIIDDHTIPESGKVKPIPGFGYGALKPTFMQSSKEAKNAAAVQAWASAVIRAQAGLSQTLSEQENVLLETLARGKGNQAQFLEVYPQVMSKFNKTMDSLEAGHRPESVMRYLDRGGDLSRVNSKYDTKAAAADRARTMRRAQQSGRSDAGPSDDDLVKQYLK